MKCKIVTGPNNYELKKIYDRDGIYTIGADIGAYMLAKSNTKFDLALGDFDSVTVSELDEIKLYAKEVIEFPKKKNSTDTYLAVEEALKRGYNDITIYGGIGNRIDHTLANIMLLKLGDIKIVTETEIMYVVDPGTYEINNEYKFVSFFAEEDVKQLSLIGFDYELDNYDLNIGDPLCVSNKGKGTISFTKGSLLVIHQKEQ